MFYFSNLENHPILSKKNLCIMGTLKDCLLTENLNQIAYFLCINKDHNFLIPPRELCAINDAVVVEDLSSTISLEDVDFTALNSVYKKEIYSDKGMLVGAVSDLSFDNRGKVSQILFGESKLNTNSISGVGEIILLKSTSKRHRKHPRVDLRSFATEDKPVSILANGKQNDTTSASQIDEADNNSETMDITPSDTLDTFTVTDEGANGNYAELPIPPSGITTDLAPVPTRIISNYNFLLGRTLTSSLYTFAGVMIAPVGTLVTIDIVDKARLNGKLLELTYNSK